MTTLVINGQRVKVSDDFLKLSPEEQARTVDEIAKSLPEGDNSANNPDPGAGNPGGTGNNPPSTPGRNRPPVAALGSPGGTATGSGTGAPPANSEGQGWMDYAGEVAGSGLAGLARGGAALVGLPGTVSDLLDQGVAYGLKKTGLVGEDFAFKPSALSGASLTDAMGAATGGATDYKGESQGAKYAGTIGEFVGGGAGAKLGVLAGAASETAGQMAEGTGNEGWARFLGAMAVPFAGAIASGVRNAGRASVGLPKAAADIERLNLAKVLDDFGVPITAGQRLGADGLRKMEGGTAAGAALNEEQAIAFTRAALKTAGTDAPRATREVMAETAERIGKAFDEVAQGVDIAVDGATANATAAAMQTYKELAPSGEVVPLIANIHKSIVKSFRSGNTIAGSTLTTWRSQLSKLTTSSSPATRDAAVETMAALDEALNNTLTSMGRASDIPKLATARQEWRNFMALQRAVTMAGEDAALGLISPARLASSVTAQGRSAVAQGKRGDIGALADAGVAVMSPLPSVLPGGVRSLAGGGQILGTAVGSLWGPAGAIAGLLLPGLGSAARMTAPAQKAIIAAGQKNAPSLIPKSAFPVGVAATTNPTANREARPYDALIGKY